MGADADADARGLGLRPAHVVLTRASLEANSPRAHLAAKRTVRRARGGTPHQVRFGWHAEPGVVRTAVIRVAPTREAIKRVVNVALSRATRDLAVRWVAKRLFWHDSGAEIRRSWKWDESDGELPLIIATADELYVPRERVEAWARDYLARPPPLQRCVETIAQQIGAVPGAAAGPPVAGVILLRGGGGVLEVCLMRDTGGRRHFPRARRRANGTRGEGECCLTAALRAIIDATGMDPTKHLDLLRGWFTAQKNGDAAWHGLEERGALGGGTTESTGDETDMREEDSVRYYVGWVSSRFKPTGKRDRRESASAERRSGTAPPRSAGADLRVQRRLQPKSPRRPVLTIKQMLQRTPVATRRPGDGPEPDPPPTAASWESVDNALRYPIWPTSEKRMIAKLLGNRAYLESWGRCGSIFRTVPPPPPPAPPPPKPPSPPPPPPTPDSLTARWIWPAPTRQLLMPQVVEEPLAFTTTATPMVSWLAAHSTEVWPTLRTMWEAHAKALDAECYDNASELAHHSSASTVPVDTEENTVVQ